MTFTYNDVEIELLGHASFRLRYKDHIIYIDPYEIEQGQKGDLILITHEHYDHCSPSDIEKVSNDDTLIITTEKAARKLRGNIRITKPGDVIRLAEIVIESVMAYNKDKPFHPVGQGVGFIITINNTRIYHTGDTDFIYEMKKIKDIDIAFLPVSGVYVMNADEAAEAVEYIRPKVAIPMHYGSIVGSLTEAEMFAEMAECEVKILSTKTCKPGECQAKEEE